MNPSSQSQCGLGNPQNSSAVYNQTLCLSFLESKITIKAWKRKYVGKYLSLNALIDIDNYSYCASLAGASSRA